MKYQANIEALPFTEDILHTCKAIYMQHNIFDTSSYDSAM